MHGLVRIGKCATVSAQRLVREKGLIQLQLCTKKTESAFSHTRYTDSVLASLEPRLFHSKLFFFVVFLKVSVA